MRVKSEVVRAMLSASKPERKSELHDLYALPRVSFSFVRHDRMVGYM